MKTLNQNKMTAVEWLEAIIKHCERFGTNIEQKDIEQAKEMEKEQIIYAGNSEYMRGWEDGLTQQQSVTDDTL